MSLLLFGASPGVDVALSGTVSGEATITGTGLLIDRPLSGTVTGEALIVAGTFDIHVALTGTVIGDAKITGVALAVFGVPLSGSITGDAQVVSGIFSHPKTAAPVDAAAQYRVAVVDRHGVLYGWMPRYTDVTPGWKLDDSADTELKLQAQDPANPLLPKSSFLGREIQVWRKRTDKPLWWGRPVQPKVDPTSITWACKDLISYFGRRNVGKPRTNYLAPYGGFDLDPAGTFPPTGWTRHNIESPDGAIVINNMVTGGKSVQVNSSTDDVDAYLQRRVDGITANDVAPYIASVWFYTADAHWIGPAFGALGLMVQACAADGSVLNAYWDGGLVEDSIEKDAWHFLTVLCGRPAGVDHYLYNLYVQGGWGVYDDARLVLPESLSYQATDLGEMLESLSVHAQSPAEGKSDLNIGRSHTVTGRQVNRNWPFEEKTNVLAGMQEYTGEGGVGISVQTPDAHTRIFTVHSPRQGTTRATELRYSKAASPASNCSSFTLTIDGEVVATSVTEVGPGSGPEREEANAADASALDGLILERIETLPSGSGIGELAVRAAALLGQSKLPVVALTMVTANVALIDAWENEELGLGDTVDAVVDWDDAFPIDEPMRIVAAQLDTKNEAMAFTLNATPVADVALTTETFAPWLGSLVGRLRSLEKRMQPSAVRIPVLWQVFNLTGPVTASTSDPWTVPDSRVLSQVRLGLKVAGTTSTVVTIYRNGTPVGTVTIAGTATTATGVLVAPFKSGDVITAGVTSAGAGAEGLVITPESVLAQAA